MARPYWSGNLKISLVTIGIKLIPATNPAGEIEFHQIERSTGRRVHHQNVVDHTPIDRSEIVKGYEYSKGKYIAVEPQEVDKLRIETKHSLEIAHFADFAEIPPALYEKPYFILPQQKEQAAAYTVIHNALEQTGKVGIGEIAFAGREHLVAVGAAPGKMHVG
jgi:DNA end-binding protein Ku